MSGFTQAIEDQQTATLQPTDTVGTPAESQTPASSSVTELANGNIVVNGRVFAPEDVAKKIEHADKHIQTLEAENAEKDATTLELLERLERLENGQRKDDAIDELVKRIKPAEQPTTTPEPAPTQEISKEELVAATLDQIKAQEVATTQKSNLATCIQEAKGMYGDDFPNKIGEKANQLGMSPAQIDEMASNQPSVFRALFLPDQAPNGKPDVTGSTLRGDIGQNAPAQKPAKSFMKMSSKERAAHIQERMKRLETN